MMKGDQIITEAGLCLKNKGLMLERLYNYLNILSARAHLQEPLEIIWLTYLTVLLSGSRSIYANI